MPIKMLASQCCYKENNRCSVSRTGYINALYEPDTEVFNVKVSGIWSNHCAFKWSIYIFFLLPAYSAAHSHIGAQGWLLTPWTGDQLVARPLPKHRTTQTQKITRTHIKHPCPGRNLNPQSRPPSDRRLSMPQIAWLPRPARIYNIQIMKIKFAPLV
jgi:hypothetical protein